MAIQTDLAKQRKYLVRILYMQYLKRFLRVVFKNGINMHQKGLDWTCLRRRPRQTPIGSSGTRRRTRGTRSPARSLSL